MKKCGSRSSLRGRASLRGCLLVSLVAIVSWLESARGVPSTCRILDRQLGLSAEQYQICLKEGSQILQNTVLKAKEEDFPTECQYWMSDSRWNCTNISMPVFPKSFQSPKHWVHKLTKETAYAQAMTSGLLLHRVVRECSAGRIPGCSCATLSDPLPSNEEWQPCNENVGYGIEFAKLFLDTMWRQDQHEVQQQREEYQPSISEQMIHLHNLEAGRRAVTQNQKTRCRCHGMTTTCQMKTCSRHIPDERLIGQLLKKKYEDAQEVEVFRAQPSLPYELLKVDSESSESDQQSHFPDHTQLVYKEDSPNYCTANSDYGATGVSGRECLLEADPYTAPKRIGLCRDVCCEAGWRTELVTEERVCSCLIDGKCDQVCSYQVQKFFCK